MRASKKISSQKKLIFSFVVDGECEYWYLEMLKDTEKSLKINLSPEIYKKKTLEEQYKRMIELAKECEKVFWIIDFDVIHKETREAKTDKKTLFQKFEELYNKCKNNNKVIVIVNNPCLEYWFLQHFEQTSKPFGTYADLEKSLKKHLPDYEKTKRYYVEKTPDIYNRLKQKLPTAISNAKKLGDFDFKNPERGMTEMHKIFNILEL